MDVWASTWSRKDKSRGELKLDYIIVVLLGMKSEYNALDDKFKFIFSDLDVNLNGLELGFHDHAWVRWIFESNIFVWIKLGEIWWLDMLLTWKSKLC